MRKISVLCVLVFALSAAPCLAQSHTWKYDDLAVDSSANDPNYDSIAAMMPDIIDLGTGTYRMYFGASINGGLTAIKSATSTDGLNWTVESGVRLLGDSDGDGGADGIAANEGIVSGPSVVRLSNGAYRMYYQASTSNFNPPDFRIKSATSIDGLVWVREGTRIDIDYPNGAIKDFSLAGHAKIVRFADNDYVIFISGNYHKSASQPSDLVTGSSSDGLTFGSFSILYANGHDPALLKLADGSGYWLFYGNLLERQCSSFSSDGKTWPASGGTNETVIQKSDGTEVTESSEPEKPGDRAVLELSSGEILLFVNWGTPTSIALARRVATATTSGGGGGGGCYIAESGSSGMTTSWIIPLLVILLSTVTIGTRLRRRPSNVV